MPVLARVIEEAAADQRPFEVATGAAGGRMHRDGFGVAWLSLIRGGSETLRLSTRLQAACGPEVAGSRPPRPTPSAHLTVARHIDRAGLAALTDREPLPAPLSWTAERIVLFRSHPGQGGSTYEVLHQHPLAR